jgi:hypothetical protein
MLSIFSLMLIRINDDHCLGFVLKHTNRHKGCGCDNVFSGGRGVVEC